MAVIFSFLDPGLVDGFKGFHLMHPKEFLIIILKSCATNNFMFFYRCNTLTVTTFMFSLLSFIFETILSPRFVSHLDKATQGASTDIKSLLSFSIESTPGWVLLYFLCLCSVFSNPQPVVADGVSAGDFFPLKRSFPSHTRYMQFNHKGLLRRLFRRYECCESVTRWGSFDRKLLNQVEQ